MRLAIQEAKKSKEDIGCGVVIVKDNSVIAKAFNTQRETCNATAHAEINALQQAGQVLRSKTLEKCTAYCTCEPCIMCLSAFSYAKIKKIVYGLSMKESYPVSRIIDVDSSLFLEKSPHKIEIVPSFLVEECRKELL